MRAVDPKKRKAADDACFHHLKGLNPQPLSRHAIVLATKVWRTLGRCLRSYGHKVGPGRGAEPRPRPGLFGFKAQPGRGRTYWQSAAGQREMRRRQRDQLTCEKRVRMAARLSKIIADDRRIPGNL